MFPLLNRLKERGNRNLFFSFSLSYRRRGISLVRTRKGGTDRASPSSHFFVTEERKGGKEGVAPSAINHSDPEGEKRGERERDDGLTIIPSAVKKEGGREKAVAHSIFA